MNGAAGATAEKAMGGSEMPRVEGAPADKACLGESGVDEFEKWSVLSQRRQDLGGCGRFADESDGMGKESSESCG